MEILREYGQPASILFPLITKSELNFASSLGALAVGDIKISKNEGAFANTTNLASHIGNGMFRLGLTASELQCARLAGTVIDQTSPKTFEDQGFVVTTYGSANGVAQHQIKTFDLEAIANKVLGQSASAVQDTAAEHSVTGLILAALESSISASTWTIKKTDATTFATKTITTDANADPITGVT